MNVEDVIFADFLLDLANCLKERQTFNIADSATDFSYNHISLIVLTDSIDTLFDLICDMRDDLHSRAEIITLALLIQHRPIDFAGCGVGIFGEVDVYESLIVTEIQISFRTVISDENLAMLIRTHCPRVDIDIRIEFLYSDFNASAFEKSAQRGGSYALTE